MANYRKILEKKKNVTSTNRGLRSNQIVVTYDLNNKRMSFFRPKRTIEGDDALTLPIFIWFFIENTMC